MNMKSRANLMGNNTLTELGQSLMALKRKRSIQSVVLVPLKITRGKDVTTFEYNAKGLLTKKTSTRGEFVQLDYDDKINKITKVINNEGWTTFHMTKAEISQRPSIVWGNQYFLFMIALEKSPR
jgi:YD repeat-containing protein